MTPSKVVVVGAGGYIGKCLLRSAGNTYKTYGTSSTGAAGLIPLSLDTPVDFDYQLVHPLDTVLLTAAISSPDICSREHDRAWAVNVTGTSEFVARLIERGARVIFFSSDTVYGERDDEFDEGAPANPSGEYAAMKYAVEQRFEGSPLFKTIRLSYVFSNEDKFTNYLSGCSDRSEEAEIFKPFDRAVIHRDDVVEAALALVQHWDVFPQPVINFGGPEVLARTDFAKILREVALGGLRYRVTEPAAAFFSKRPRVIQMTSPVLASLLGRPARTLRQAAMIEFNIEEEI